MGSQATTLCFLLLLGVLATGWFVTAGILSHEDRGWLPSSHHGVEVEAVMAVGHLREYRAVKTQRGRHGEC